ncbi:MAG: zinc ribbon domain-containing protein [Candidatus Hydrothermales bacterium]
MPIFEFMCERCNNVFEELVLPYEAEPDSCPRCGEKSIRKLWRGSVGLVFKGSGFYVTDYAKNKKRENREKEESKGKKEGNNSCCSTCSCSI